MPPTNQPRVLNANVDSSRIASVQSAAQAGNFPQVVGAAHPAAVNTNSIQVFSASGGSSQSRKRLLQFARGEALPAAKRPEVEGLLGAFDARMQHHVTQQALQGQAALMTAASGCCCEVEMS